MAYTTQVPTLSDVRNHLSALVNCPPHVRLDVQVADWDDAYVVRAVAYDPSHKPLAVRRFAVQAERMLKLKHDGSLQYIRRRAETLLARCAEAYQAKAEQRGRK